jgi:chloramphenicol O-acetyltransferase
MREIDLERWPRREHFDLYRAMDFGHVNLCIEADITELWETRRRAGVSATILLTYTIAKAANRVPELRQRIRGDRVVEHDVVHPVITVLGGDDAFGFCTLVYDEAFARFADSAMERIEAAKHDASLRGWPHDLEGKPSRDDLLSMTIVPWFSFTSFAITRQPACDTLPLIAWGKVISADKRHALPLFVNFHHALVDGVHIGRFFSFVEEEARDLAASF